MYQYRINKLLRITNADTLTVEVDLGFNVTTQVTFKIARLTVPELDLDSDVDPAMELRRSIIAWFRKRPKPWILQTYKEGNGYTGDVLDDKGNILVDDVQSKPWTIDSDETTVIPVIPAPTSDPGVF